MTHPPSNLGQLPALGLSPPALQSFTSGPALLQVLLSWQKSENKSEKNNIFQAALQQQLALQCFPSQQGKVKTYHIQHMLCSLWSATDHFNFIIPNFVPDDEQHGDPPLLSLLPAKPHNDPLHLAAFLLHLLLAATLHPRDQQQHPGFKHHLRSFLFQPALLRVTHLGFAQVVGNPEIQSESQRILSLAAFTGRLAASLGLGSSLAALHPPAQWPLPLPPPEPALSTHLYPLVLQSSKCLFKKLSFS